MSPETHGRTAARLGKANHIVNALYARASADRAIDLTFFSALTLGKTAPDNPLERRFITPVIDRLFGGTPIWPMPSRCAGDELPPNIRVIEFLPSPDDGCTWLRRSRTIFRQFIPCKHSEKPSGRYLEIR